MSPMATMRPDPRPDPWAITGAAGAQRRTSVTQTAMDRMRHRNARRSILLDQLRRLVLSSDHRSWHSLVPQIRIQRVIADVQRLAGLAFIPVVFLEHIARISAAPRAHRVATLKCRHQMLGIVAAQADWKIVHPDLPRLRGGDGAFDHAFQLAHVAGP